MIHNIIFLLCGHKLHTLIWHQWPLFALDLHAKGKFISNTLHTSVYWNIYKSTTQNKHIFKSNFPWTFWNTYRNTTISCLWHQFRVNKAILLGRANFIITLNCNKQWKNLTTCNQVCFDIVRELNNKYLFLKHNL